MLCINTRLYRPQRGQRHAVHSLCQRPDPRPGLQQWRLSGFPTPVQRRGHRTAVRREYHPAQPARHLLHQLHRPGLGRRGGRLVPAHPRGGPPAHPHGRVVRPRLRGRRPVGRLRHLSGQFPRLLLSPSPLPVQPPPLPHRHFVHIPRLRYSSASVVRQREGPPLGGPSLVIDISVQKVFQLFAPAGMPRRRGKLRSIRDAPRERASLTFAPLPLLSPPGWAPAGTPMGKLRPAKTGIRAHSLSSKSLSASCSGWGAAACAGPWPRSGGCAHG